MGREEKGRKRKIVSESRKGRNEKGRKERVEKGS